MYNFATLSHEIVTNDVANKHSENDSIDVHNLGVGSRLVAEWIVVAKGLRDIERRVSKYPRRPRESRKDNGGITDF